MARRILTLGYGSTAGAWKIRGQELGGAIGACVMNGGLNGVAKNQFDLAIVVKKGKPDYLTKLHLAHIPIVWDIVDGWPQPMGNWWPRDACLQWLKTQIKAMRPAALVVGTSTMAKDCAKFNLPTLILPHHARPDSQRTPIRPEIKVVGYEGKKQYLGRWEEVLQVECATRGWTFVVNPESLNALDVVVAFREQNGYAAKNYKSQIKLANAQGTGTPCVLNRERAYLETACGVELWADTSVELTEAFDRLAALKEKKRVSLSDIMYEAAPRLPQLAQVYRNWLETV